MPLTDKGREIMANMRKEYKGDPEKAKAVFYASRNKGKITGVDHAKKIAGEIKGCKKNG
jgi:hypothetical protein